MERTEARNNLTITGKLFVFMGLLGLLATSLSIYWKIEGAVLSGFKLLVSIAFIYFGYLILSSTKVLLAKT